MDIPEDIVERLPCDKVDFFNFIKENNAKILIEEIKSGFKAKLIGPFYENGAYDGFSLIYFESFGDAEESAVASLRGELSGKLYYYRDLSFWERNFNGHGKYMKKFPIFI